MGWGDEIMLTGQARVLQESDQRPILVRDRNGNPRTNPMWLGNPRIAAQPGPGQQEIRNGPGLRPYIKQKAYEKWTWRAGACHRGEIYLTEEELAFAAGFKPDVIIEPNCKPNASPNKDWGFDRWQRLADLMLYAGLRPTQLGATGVRVLRGASLIITPSFRHACAVLARARAAVLPEGGLHHAAAALGVPALVIFGGYIAPEVTGYPEQVSLFVGTGLGCGMRVACKHCRDAMAQITPDAVFERLTTLLKGRA